MVGVYDVTVAGHDVMVMLLVWVLAVGSMKVNV
jgi:hypothetical protein